MRLCYDDEVVHALLVAFVIVVGCFFVCCSNLLLELLLLQKHSKEKYISLRELPSPNSLASSQQKGKSKINKLQLGGCFAHMP